MASLAVGIRRARESVTFRVKRQARYLAWWVRWGWRPYGAYHRYAMDKLALNDPKQAVGGLWDLLGPMQLEVLKGLGLRPEHSILDIGCGALRGGRHIISYVQPGNYVGLDISPEILQAARRLVHEEGLEDRGPEIHLTQGFRFSEVAGRQFDCVHAFAVLTDVPVELVDECFANLSKVLKPGGLFVATYVPGAHYIPDPVRIGFQYPLAQLQEIGRRHGFSVEAIPDFHHPRGHQMIAARTQESTVRAVR